MSKNSVELKPCPFCGGEVKMVSEEWAKAKFHSFLCDRCLMYTTYQLIGIEDAIETWNRREPNNYNINAVIKKLEAQRDLAFGERNRARGAVWYQRCEGEALGIDMAINIVKKGCASDEPKD